MSLSQSAHETSPSNTASTQEQLDALSHATTQERAGLNNDVTNQFSGVPQMAVKYLTVNCKQPEHLSVALNILREALKQNPSLLEDEFEAEMELDDCLHQAEIIALNTAIETEQNEGDELDANIESLKSRITGNLKGADKAGQIMQLISDVSLADGFEEAERTAALKHLTQISNTLKQLLTAFTDPVKQGTFQQIVNFSAIDLGNSSISQTFTPILKQVEMSGVFTDIDKRRLHIIVTGSEVQDVLSEKTEDGDYVHTETNKRPIRTGVEGYTEPSGRQIIEAKAGQHTVTKDVSGWSGEDVGLLVELMHYWNVTESNGTTGFVENIYQVDFSILDSGGAFDPLTVKKFQQIISHMTGGFAGYDGDMENFEEKQTLIQNQSRLLSETQTAFGWENDQAGTSRVLKRLGVWSEDSHPNMDVIKSFGDYTQRYFASGSSSQIDLIDYLHEQNPEQVKPLTDMERETMSLEIEVLKTNRA